MEAEGGMIGADSKDPNSTEGAYMEVACDALRAPK